MLVSDRVLTSVHLLVPWCLNPCFSGCWSRTLTLYIEKLLILVLILVLVDVGLGLEKILPGKPMIDKVLILVLVDVGLGHVLSLARSLHSPVLILVLVDVGLGPQDEF